MKATEIKASIAAAVRVGMWDEMNGTDDVVLVNMGIDIESLGAVEGEWESIPDDDYDCTMLSSILGEDDALAVRPKDVKTFGDKLIICGDNGQCLVFWAFKKK